MNNAIDLLLKVDLDYAAASLGLDVERANLITEKNLYEIINQIEVALLNDVEPSIISGVCGLLWTHFAKEFDLLPEYIYGVMSKIGFSPVGPMLSMSQIDTKVNFTSLISMLETTAQRQRFSVVAFNRRFFLTEFQWKMWRALVNRKHIAVSAPTSAGKSFLICLNLVYGMVERGGISVYVVPNLTLMAQVANDLISLAHKYAPTIEVRTGFSSQESDSPTIYVLTQERLIEPSARLPLGKLNFLIIDEVQNIERAFDFSSSDERSRLLLDVLIDLHDNYLPCKTVILGPRIDEVGELGRQLFRKQTAAITAGSSPVTNICYGISPATKKSEKINIVQYSDLKPSPLIRTFQNTINANGFGKSTYDEDFYEYLALAVKHNGRSLIFSPTSTQARRTAVKIASTQNIANDNKLIELAKYIETTVSDTYDLARCVSRGVAFHHGKMPQHVRNAVELALSWGKFNYITCTTTLMQGVNIPARTIFVRNPNLFLKRSAATTVLSAYEVANLRGRAGRLMRDFVGRMFVLDGTSFDVGQQESLFDSPSKILDGSYKKTFTENRNEILHSILNDGAERTPIAKYISSVVYTDPSAAITLSRKGISLTDAEFIHVKKSVMRLSIPIDVCKSHRFWDPFDLQKIYDKLAEFDLPTSPFDAQCAKRLERIIYSLIKITPQRAEHFLGKTNLNDPMPWVIAINATNWATETPLRELLDNDFSRKSNDNTERSIAMFQNTVSFGLPSLLSPLYKMAGKSEFLLKAIERGAYRPETLLQLDSNIPRETAISLTNAAKQKNRKIESIDDALSFLCDVKARYWSAIQFRHLIDIDSITK
jgi:hypothetical protein